MVPFLNDYITSLSSRRQERIYDLLASSKVQKEQLDSLVEKLTDFTKQAPMLIAKEQSDALITAEKFRLTFRDLSIRVADLYKISNLISLLLNSHSSVLSSDIKSIEDEILAMEKAIDSYGFLLSDGGSYDYSFVETFSDETMREKFDWPIPDRVNNVFQVNETASVNSAAGILTLSPSVVRPYGLNALVLKNNCFGFITSDTGITNALNTASNTGWRVAIASPTPINSNIETGLDRGAQCLVELTLNNPSPCDTIIINPFSDLPIEVLRIDVFTSLDNESKTTVHNTTKVIDRPTHFSFPLQSVVKFEIIINQPAYKRGALLPNKGEEDYRKVSNTLSSEKKNVASILGLEHKKNVRVYRTIIQMSETASNKQPHFFRAELPSVDFDARSGPLTLDKILFKRNSLNGQSLQWTDKSMVNPIISRMFQNRIFGSSDINTTQYYSFNINSSSIANSNTLLQKRLSNPDQSYPKIPVQGPSPQVDLEQSGIVSQLSYEYNFGIRSIQIGTGISTFKGAYISKALPAPGDSGDIKLKVKDTNYRIINNTQRDIDIVTSVEYSVTNKSNPQKEEDWIPILPIDSQSIEGERFFVNELGRGYFRFPASVEDNISLYKNGYGIALDKMLNYIFAPNNQSVIGLQFSVGEYTSSDIFLCSYMPVGDRSFVNFENYGFTQTPLASAFDSSGPGQTFQSTGPDRTITLNESPFVDLNKVAANSTYGTDGFGGTYQPITIIMADGTVAINMTNYLSNSQNTLNPIDAVTYIHSGKNIRFNNVINNRFTVYYHYSPSNIRFRTILRSNDVGFVSPIVDYVQVKTKTRKSDPRKIM